MNDGYRDKSLGFSVLMTDWYRVERVCICELGIYSDVRKIPR